jgi:hypothetical protein
MSIIPLSVFKKLKWSGVDIADIKMKDKSIEMSTLEAIERIEKQNKEIIELLKEFLNRKYSVNM